ncbi:MAG: DUF4340 domain-containing protein, partial [Pseudomonadales bacterium]|nr:DUF4340 domain-containing protein [Pseudomonadales bacterium]
MNTRLPVLAAILGIQLLLIAAFVLFQDEAGEASAFFSVDPSSIEKLRIEGEGAEIELVRSTDGWTFPDGTPADGGKIEALFEKLSKTSGVWPVATSAASQERFEVTEANHQRRLTVSTAQLGEIELYFGTSPGYRRVHARRADVEAVYSIDFANHELPTSRDEWLDKTLLQSEDVSKVALRDGWVLERTAEGWQVNGEAADPVAVQRVIDRLEGIRVVGFADPQLAFEPTRFLSITDALGTFTLELALDPSTDEYVVQSDRVTGRFTLASYVAEQLLGEADALQAAEP